MKISNFLYQSEKLSRDVRVLLSLDSKKIIRRVKNKIVGRLLARVGFWKFLWR